MAIPKRYLANDAWPHQYALTGKVEQGPQFTTITESQCHHCGLSYWVGKEQRPIGVCPARTDKEELKRLRSD